MIDRFHALVAERLGLALDPARAADHAELVRRRAASHQLDLEAYLALFARSSDEVAAVARELVVAETYLFRNAAQFHALAALLPAVARRRPPAILSAGCATGDEAYSIAIVALEALGLAAPVSIRAVDVSLANLERARRARFSPWAMRETAEAVRQRWFRSDGRDAVLDERARTLVRFEQRNLAADDPELWPAGGYDVVFCRNVLMYLTPDAMRALVARIGRALVPGGYLFLGHAETLRGLSEQFELCHTHDTFYYRRLAEAAVDTSWASEIFASADRIAAITPAVPPPPAASLDQVLVLVRDERYADALALLDGVEDRDAPLVRAVLLAHLGELERAEAACHELLLCDAANAGAHYVLALCRDSAGDRAGAVEHDHVAAVLDPSFAMPRLHLGVLARRDGDRQAAQRELGLAAQLLEHEQAARVVLFGGGFRREALIALCQAELGR